MFFFVKVQIIGAECILIVAFDYSLVSLQLITARQQHCSPVDSKIVAFYSLPRSVFQQIEVVLAIKRCREPICFKQVSVNIEFPELMRSSRTKEDFHFIHLIMSIYSYNKMSVNLIQGQLTSMLKYEEKCLCF